ncbi:MAG: hypothetical protein QOJ36_859 [Verrucomicrobiota bacterium]
MTGRFSFDRERQVATPNPGQQFLAGLNGAFSPTMLLGFETVHIHRQFGGSNNVGKENKFPTGQLRAIAKIEILAKRVVLPAASLLDTRAAPKTGRAVEIKKASASTARRLLKQKMAVQKHGLHPRQQRVASIQMTPPGLDHADLRIGEKMDCPLKQIWRGDEVGIENANKLTGGRFEPDCERTGLESGPVDAMNQLNIEAALSQCFRTRCSHLARIVGRIVQHLDLQQISRVIELTDRTQKALDYVNFVKNWKLDRYSWQLPEMAGRDRCAFAVLQEEINDEIPVNAVGRKADEHGEVTRRPNHRAEASLHKVVCQLLRQQVRMMAVPSPASNQKWRDCLGKTGQKRTKIRSMSIFIALVLASAAIGANQEEPNEDKEHEREELGVNPYTAPSIEKIFAQLDQLRPLPFDQLKRELPQSIAVGREHKGMIFGELIADGFLIVEAERKNLVENFGRVLMEQARALGVGDRVMRHSASLTELGRRGEWQQVRAELIATQTDVEQAMIELRDEKMAHLISLGGWLRGLEISAGAAEAEFSPQRTKLLAQPELADYFAAELKTLPPTLAHTPLFERIRAGVKKLQPILSKSPEALTRADAGVIRAEAGELNDAIRRGE